MRSLLALFLLTSVAAAEPVDEAVGKIFTPLLEKPSTRDNLVLTMVRRSPVVDGRVCVETWYDDPFVTTAQIYTLNEDQTEALDVEFMKATAHDGMSSGCPAEFGYDRVVVGK